MCRLLWDKIADISYNSRAKFADREKSNAYGVSLSDFQKVINFRLDGQRFKRHNSTLKSTEHFSSPIIMTHTYLRKKINSVRMQKE